ncbi:MAG: tRNA (adenosine(37)-N6)-threonylcarbamoyltransferase complex ATPase subunit type 1 TsaE [Treponema sp.]|jgi:tRNA threonylcarbamoyladenosine biosynthesis protein TsaE|nr:tRNA (adenosine(37)-N6)-threonylcarbamoyltransferase complex ATPase subunit type 1 TsaE [Treponema sp.]
MEISLPFDIVSFSEKETQDCGRSLSLLLGAGSVVALRGGLGAGKTCFTKGVAAGFDVAGTVTSPTYTIISEYEGKWPDGRKTLLYHIDAYRLNGDDDFAALGAEEFLYGDGVAVIEWSERIPASIPKDAVFVDIEAMENGGRRISGRRLADTAKP